MTDAPHDLTDEQWLPSASDQEEQSNLGFWIEKRFAEKDAECARWKLHAERWEEVARNLGQVLAVMPTLADTFRRVCEAHEVTP